MRVDCESLDFAIPCRSRRFRVIDVVADQIITRRSEAPVPAEDDTSFRHRRDFIRRSPCVEHAGKLRRLGLAWSGGWV